jgi:RNase P/RNase MRP subunit p29
MYNGMLIGMQIEVLASLDKTLVKKCGIAIDETKNLLILRSENGRILKLPKSVVTLLVQEGKGKKQIQIDGRNLIGTPEERIKS